MRRGTSQRPVRVTSPKRWSIRTRSLACGGIPSEGRSAVSPARSPVVRADNAASKRSSSSAAMSRPSPAAICRISTTCSRSRSDARSSGVVPCLEESPADLSSPVMPAFWWTAQSPATSLIATAREAVGVPVNREQLVSSGSSVSGFPSPTAAFSRVSPTEALDRTTVFSDSRRNRTTRTRCTTFESKAEKSWLPGPAISADPGLAGPRQGGQHLLLGERNPGHRRIRMRDVLPPRCHREERRAGVVRRPGLVVSW